ncbi:GNAT family N-acetyltransferase [bacterium]|nr:GNAT family N-acetyltransferase [bacterium]
MLKFNKIKLNEIKEFAELTSEIWHEYWTCILSKEQIDYMVEKFQSEKAITNQINNENYAYFYIMIDSQKAGYIGLSSKEDYLFLSKLYIKKEYRYKGIGGKAFDFIKQYAIENGYNKIQLTVNKYNKNTIDAYNKWGFKTVDSVVTDIGNGFVMDDYIMKYEIGEKL